MKPFHKILLINLLVCGIVCAGLVVGVRVFDKVHDTGILVLTVVMVFIALQGIACWITSLVYFLSNKTSHGFGFLLSGLMVWVIGFGTCSLALVRL